jgi:L-amino acid N-acyltransferase YncA
MITYTTADTATDLEGILKLQKANLARDLTHEEIQSQGFVTVDHTFAQLKKLNDAEKHIIAKDKDRVVAYLLAMTKDCRQDIPILFPMFEVFDSIRYNNRKVSECNYLVVGQVCVDKQYRGQGILDRAYAAYRDHFSSKYDFAITEIAATNTRSRNAHQRIGFREVHSYRSPDGVEWVVVIWEWDN